MSKPALCVGLAAVARGVTECPELAPSGSPRTVINWRQSVTYSKQPLGVSDLSRRSLV